MTMPPRTMNSPTTKRTTTMTSTTPKSQKNVQTQKKTQADIWNGCSRKDTTHTTKMESNPRQECGTENPLNQSIQHLFQSMMDQPHPRRSTRQTSNMPTPQPSMSEDSPRAAPWRQNHNAPSQACNHQLNRPAIRPAT